MAVVTVSVRRSDAARMIRKLRDQAPKAIARAINRSADSAVVAMGKAISQDTGMKVKDVRERIWIRKATPQQRVAQLLASPKRIPLMDFSANGPQPSRGKGRGVSWRIGQGPRTRERSAFIATMRSGHRGVFRRIGPSTRRSLHAWAPNLPIVELHGVSIVHVFEKHLAVGVARAQEQLVKNLRHEFRFAMRQAT